MKSWRAAPLAPTLRFLLAMSFSNPFYRYVTGHQPEFAPYHFPTGSTAVAVSLAPPARLLDQGATGTVEGVESRQGRGRAPLDLRPGVESGLQQHGQRESKEGEGSWMASGLAGRAQADSPG